MSLPDSTAYFHPCVWHLFFFPPVPSLLYQAVVSFPITTAKPLWLCWRGWASYHRFQQSQEPELAVEFCHGWQESPECPFSQTSGEGSIWKQTGQFHPPHAVWHLLCSCRVVGSWWAQKWSRDGFRMKT